MHLVARHLDAVGPVGVEPRRFEIEASAAFCSAVEHAPHRAAARASVPPPAFRRALDFDGFSRLRDLFDQLLIDVVFVHLPRGSRRTRQRCVLTFNFHSSGGLRPGQGPSGAAWLLPVAWALFCRRGGQRDRGLPIAQHEHGLARLFDLAHQLENCWLHRQIIVFMAEPLM